MATHTSGQKGLHILQTESQSSTSLFLFCFVFFVVVVFNRKLLVANDDQLSLTYLAAQSKVVHLLVQRLWNAFSEIYFLALIFP